MLLCTCSLACHAYVLVACLQVGAEWAAPSDGVWASKGIVQRLVNERLSQEADVLGAVGRVIHNGVRAGNVKCALPITSKKKVRVQLEREGPASAKTARSADAARLAREAAVRVHGGVHGECRAAAHQGRACCEAGGGHVSTRLTKEVTVQRGLAVRASDRARKATQRTESRVSKVVLRAKKNLDSTRKRGQAARAKVQKAANAGAKQMRDTAQKVAAADADKSVKQLRAERDRARARACGVYNHSKRAEMQRG
eukprot:4555925-Pleurochrysis_carterae.AAC.1